MKISVRDLGGTPVLAGAVSGRAMLGQLLVAVGAEPERPEPVFLDFAGVEVATASFLRESVLAFRDAVRGGHSNFYPVIANANEAVREELALLLRVRGDALMACALAEGGAVSAAAPLGDLDPKQRFTFDLVRERGETDAGTLMRDFGESEGVTRTTAWNNRLAALAALGLVVEESQGRAKRYRALFTEEAA